jgi:short-subunit dehydrogenase
MKILLTGSSSGIGAELKQQLRDHNLVCPTRQELDLGDLDQVSNFINCRYDMLINCAGTGIGGKIDFVNHESGDIRQILNVNLLGPILLSRACLKQSLSTKIVNITSTNNNRYHANDLAYSLSKLGLSDFGKMLQIEYSGVKILEVRTGLTKTSFNKNRYASRPDRFVDIYSQHPCLESAQVAKQIHDVLFDDHVKFIEVAP